MAEQAGRLVLSEDLGDISEDFICFTAGIAAYSLVVLGKCRHSILP